MTQEKPLIEKTITSREIIESCDYSGGINWDKMLPPETEEMDQEWVRKEIIATCQKKMFEEIDKIRDCSSDSDWRFLCNEFEEIILKNMGDFAA